MDDDGSNSLVALKSHILRSGGRGHDDPGSYPPYLDETELTRYVYPVDEC